MKHLTRLLFLIGALQCAALAQAQGLAAGFGLVVYPSDGQTADKQARDEGECYQWGKTTTGVDPANPMAGVQTAQPAAQAPQGAQAAGGAARGAAAGALIGNIADEDAGEYAAAGALIGGIRRAKRAKQAQAGAQQQSAAQNSAAQSERIKLFTNAFSACMEGRKYTVK